MNSTLHDLCQEMTPWLRETRRYLHQHPEASAKETNTQAYLKQTLEAMGYEVQTGFYDTGLAVVILGNKPGPVTGMRFDMDALKIDELCSHDYVSKNPGLMHACGHDGHMTMGLGIARALTQLKDSLEGTVKLIFQPAEEDSFNGGGAQYMIRDGVLDNPKVDRIFGMHVYPGLPSGQILSRPGAITASSDPFTLTLTGKGSHAAEPHNGRDPIVAGGYILTALQSIVARNVGPFDQAVVTVGVFQGGSRYNIIPDTARMEGTVRTFRETTRQDTARRVKAVIENTAAAMDVSADLDYRFSYPSTVNNEALLEEAIGRIRRQRGDVYATASQPMSGSEDFAYFAQAVPAVYFCLGIETEDNGKYPVHNPHFDFDESALAAGVETFLSLVVSQE